MTKMKNLFTEIMIDIFKNYYFSSNPESPLILGGGGPYTDLLNFAHILNRLPLFWTIVLSMALQQTVLEFGYSASLLCNGQACLLLVVKLSVSLSSEFLFCNATYPEARLYLAPFALPRII